MLNSLHRGNARIQRGIKSHASTENRHRGFGSGGYVAALRAARLGASVTLVEKERLGGRVSKRMHPHESPRRFGPDRAGTSGGRADSASASPGNLKSISRASRKGPESRRDPGKGIRSLLESWGIEIVRGTARLEKKRDRRRPKRERERKIFADRTILATGSKPAEIRDPDRWRTDPGQRRPGLDERSSRTPSYCRRRRRRVRVRLDLFGAGSEGSRGRGAGPHPRE